MTAVDFCPRPSHIQDEILGYTVRFRGHVHQTVVQARRFPDAELKQLGG